jgi:hypothetical protein
VRALGAAAGGYLAGFAGVAVWIEAVFPETAAASTRTGVAVCALAFLALCGDVAAIALGAAALRAAGRDPSPRRGLAISAVVLGAVGLLGVLLVTWLGYQSIWCGQNLDACRSGWTRT